MNDKYYFQWVDGPKTNEITTLISVTIEDGEIYLNLADGSRCNRQYVALLNCGIDKKILAHISSPNNKWNIYNEEIPEVPEKYAMNNDGEQCCIQLYEPKRTIKRVTPPKTYHVDVDMLFDRPIVYQNIDNHADIKTSNPHRSEETRSLDKTTIQEKQIPKNINVSDTPNTNNTQDNMLACILQKSKKTLYNANMDISLSIPSKEIFNVIVDSFDTSIDELIELIMDDVDVDEIKAALVKSILEIYKK